MIQIKKHIPNAITLCNVTAGFVSLIFIAQQKFEIALALLVFGLIFDFLDGFTARKLNAFSELGLQLDSLADLISFGIAPAYMLHVALANQFGALSIISLTPVLLVIASTYRLANFNIQEASALFKGLATPANAVAISSLAFVINSNIDLSSSPSRAYVITIIIFIQSYLLNANILTLSFKQFKAQSKIPFVIILVGAIALCAIFNISGLLLSVWFYVIVSVFSLHRKRI